MLAAALVILALAEPVLNPNREHGARRARARWCWSSTTAGRRPRTGRARTFMIERLIAEAEGQSRPVMIVPTASAAKSIGRKIEAPAAARSTAAALQPQPFAPGSRGGRRRRSRGALGGAAERQRRLADATASTTTARRARSPTGCAALAGGGFAVVETRPGQEALGASAGVGQRRPARGAGAARRGRGAQRRRCMPCRRAASGSARRRSRSTPARRARSPTFDLPLELRNQVTRIEIAGERSAGAVQPARCALAVAPRRHLSRARSREQAQPLLAPLYYIERALHAVLRDRQERRRQPGRRPSTALIKRNVSVLMLADIGTLPQRDQEARRGVGEEGRRAGALRRPAAREGRRRPAARARCASAAARSAARCRGRRRSRWRRSATTSLFAGLPVPPEVLVSQPGAGRSGRARPRRARCGRASRTARRWSPRRKRGDGQLVFFHVTANSDWSNLPLSGLFVEMLRRIASLGKLGRRRRRVARRRRQATAGAAGRAEVLPPLQVLDGFGLLKSPPPTTQAHRRRQDRRRQAERREPAGLLRPGRRAARRSTCSTPRACSSRCRALPAGAERRVYESDSRPAREAAAAGSPPWRCCSPTSWPCCCCRRAASALLARARAAPAARCALAAAGARRAGLLIAAPAPAQRPDRDRAAEHAGRRRARHPGDGQGHLRLCAHRRCRPPTRPAGTA